MTNAQLLPALIAPLVIWRVYRRVRRNVGRQTMRTKRSAVLVALMTFVIVATATLIRHYPNSLLGLVGGIALGAIVAAVGIKLTRFEVSGGAQFYTPNPYLGIAISLLLVARLIYRSLILYSGNGAAVARVPSAGQSPLTFFLLGVTLGYYVGYSTGLLIRFSSHGKLSPDR